MTILLTALITSLAYYRWFLKPTSPTGGESEEPEEEPRDPSGSRTGGSYPGPSTATATAAAAAAATPVLRPQSQGSIAEWYYQERLRTRSVHPMLPEKSREEATCMVGLATIEPEAEAWIVKGRRQPMHPFCGPVLLRRVARLLPEQDSKICRHRKLNHLRTNHMIL